MSYSFLRRDALVHGESSRVRVNNASRTIRGGTRVDATMASTLSTWKRFWRGSKPLVHTVRLQGMIATGRAPGSAPQPLNLESVERHLASAFSKKVMPDAVAITVNSPGGSPVQSDLIYTRIRALAKETGIPVFTFAEDVAASGGYYLLAAGADGVYCRDTSIVGSVGVVSGGFGFVDAIKRLGVERRVHASGRSKVQLDPFLPEKEEDSRREKAHPREHPRILPRRGARREGRKTHTEPRTRVQRRGVHGKRGGRTRSVRCGGRGAGGDAGEVWRGRTVSKIRRRESNLRDVGVLLRARGGG